MEEKKGSEVVVTEADIDWAYGVLSQVREAMDKATGDGEASGQLMAELIEQMPDILEALILLVDKEHQPMVAQAMTSWVRWLKSWKTIL